jgi:hypothetical protein
MCSSHNLFYMGGLSILFSTFYTYGIERSIAIMDAHKRRAKAAKTRPEASHTPVPLRYAPDPRPVFDIPSKRNVLPSTYAYLTNRKLLILSLRPHLQTR